MSGKERDALPDHHLILGDCLDPLTGLSTLSDKSVDHFVCDPPFGEQIYDNMRTNKRTADNGLHAQRANAGYSAMEFQDIDIACREMARIARRWVIVFMDAETVHLWRERLSMWGARHIRTGAFVKSNPMPQVSGDRPGQGFESIQISHVGVGGRVRWNGGGRAAVWSSTTAQAEGQPVVHGTQKPLCLMQSLISDFTDPGELVCDPFAGSGTTLVACKRLGRRAIGWERDATFWERAVRRLENTKQQYELIPRQPKPKQLKLGGA